jgi:cell division protein ZapE
MPDTSKHEALYLMRMAEMGLEPDAAQLEAIQGLARVHAGLFEGRPRTGMFLSIKENFLGAGPVASPVQGLYMWGGVGRGKTTLMDLFFDSLPFEDKLRYHFHRMMYRVHNRLKELDNVEDPIQIVADEFADQARVICFDEFFVSDIGDAMILGRLMQALFERHVTLVATSNIPPENLYAGGLQRQRFLPCIALIETHTQVLQVDSDVDYRLRVLEQAEIYHSPLDAAANENLQSYFNQIAPDEGSKGQSIEILGRNLTTIRRADGIAWFSFGTLCDGPRSKDDYIELARTFSTLLLSNVPQMGIEQEDQARRFIALVDEFYDRRVKLIISAAEPISHLYKGKRVSMEFERTRSRLREMQSTAYLAEAHLP